MCVYLCGSRITVAAATVSLVCIVEQVVLSGACFIKPRRLVGFPAARQRITPPGLTRSFPLAATARGVVLFLSLSGNKPLICSPSIVEPGAPPSLRNSFCCLCFVVLPQNCLPIVCSFSLPCAASVIVALGWCQPRRLLPTDTLLDVIGRQLITAHDRHLCAAFCDNCT